MYGSRPNILCFVTDQQRADHLGCAGNRDLATPNIDRIAGQGVRFSNSFVSSPICMPNRATLFTGKYPQAHGLTESGVTLSPDSTTLAGLLRDAGYETASFGKLHLAPFGLSPAKARAGYELLESRHFWDGDEEMPLPYYGFERVWLVGGHGHFAFGDYKRELDRYHPGMYAKLFPDQALTPRSGARESWKSAIPAELHYDAAIADKAIEFINRRDTYPPFFLWCSFPDPHHPYCPPRPFCDRYDPEKIAFAPVRREGELDDLPGFFRDAYEGRRRVSGLKGDVRRITDEHYREILAHTYGSISMIDHHIGRVLDAVERRGQMEETVIVFLSDHGELMGDHWLINKGPFFYDSLLKVPTIWRLPGGRRRGEADPSMVAAVDFLPTVLDLADVRVPPDTQGISYAPLLREAGPARRDRVYIEFDDGFIDERGRHMRTREWAVTHFAGRDYGLLFDLSRDPDELHNLWDSPDCGKIKEKLLLELLHQVTQAAPWTRHSCNA